MSSQTGPGGLEQPAAPAPQRGWLSRNWKWFVPAMLVLLLLICGGACAGIVFTVIGVIKGSTPYQMALKQVREDPQVIEQLGEPIEDATVFPTGEVSTVNDTGTARLLFDVRGPNGIGHVSVQARMIDGQWGLTELAVKFDDGQRLVLDAGHQENLDDAPPWQP